MTTAQSERTDSQKMKQDQPQFSSSSIIEDLYPSFSPSQAPTGGGLEAQIAWQAYFDLADHSVRTARRASEALFINSLRNQIVQEVRAQVLNDVRQQIQQQFQQQQQGRQQQ